MKSAEGSFLVLSLLILALGIAYAGMSVRDGLKDFKSYDQYVTVKGLAEKDVVSDLGVWPISYTETGNDLPELQKIMENRGAQLVSFLMQNGLQDNEITRTQLNVQDLLAQSYRQGDIGQGRYILTQTYMTRTGNIEALSKAAQNIGDLIKQGVVLSQGGEGPTYLFTKLNEIKPEMIAQATRNAREAATQFAADSGAQVGAIRSANQGVFQILPRDQTYAVSEAQQINKTVRVVSTLDFYLE